MNKRTITKAERRLQLIRDAKIGWVFIFIGILAFIAFIYSGRKYNLTFIQFKYILLGSLVAGLTIGTLILKYSQRTNGKSFNIWKHYLWASLVYGSLFCGVFFWTNSNFSKANSYIIKTPILARLKTVRYSHIYVTVKIADIEKDIPMPNVEIAEVNNSNFVILNLKKGFWGFTYIVDKKLSRN